MKNEMTFVSAELAFCQMLSKKDREAAFRL